MNLNPGTVSSAQAILPRVEAWDGRHAGATLIRRERVFIVCADNTIAEFVRETSGTPLYADQACLLRNLIQIKRAVDESIETLLLASEATSRKDPT